MVNPGYMAAGSHIINAGVVVNQAQDRKLIIYQSTNRKYIAAIKLDWNGKSKKWLVTAYGKNDPQNDFKPPFGGSFTSFSPLNGLMKREWVNNIIDLKDCQIW